MDRISTATRAADLFGAGKHGFRDGDLPGGISPTDLNAAWFNGVQEELMSVIEAGGLVPSAADRTQARQAIQGLIAAAMPAGTVVFVARNTAPAGYLKANGAAVSRVTYAALFAAIGTTFGAGDGATTFTLPDMRGEFPRGWDDGRGIDTGRVIGSAQSDAIKDHVHYLNQNLNTANFTPAVGAAGVAGNTGGPTAGFTNGVISGTAAETRPRNIALLACIKF